MKSTLYIFTSKSIFAVVDVLKHIILVVLIASMLVSTLMVPLIYLDFSVRRDYIAEVLCINRDEPITVCGGSCYLTEQLKLAAEQQEKEANTPNQKLEFSFFYKALTSLNLHGYPRSLSSQTTGYHDPDIRTSYLPGIFRPPRTFA